MMLAEYTVLFSNAAGCAVGISDVTWSVKVVADCEASALDLAWEQAQAINDERGMPPHGIRLRPDALRGLAFVYGEPTPLGRPAAG